MTIADATRVKVLFGKARTTRQRWEGLWQECFEFTQPHRSFDWQRSTKAATKNARNLFDSTACDAVEQLAASLLAELAPPWSDWFGAKFGTLAPAELQTDIDLAGLVKTMRVAIDKSNLAIELHQAFLDLVTIGTSCILIEQASPGSHSPLRFTAIPSNELYIEGNSGGGIKRVFRNFSTNVEAVAQRFPNFDLSRTDWICPDNSFVSNVDIIEMFEQRGDHWHYSAVADLGSGQCLVIDQGIFEEVPILAFRWTKSAGEVFGRSPVMTALADIKTANKVVELILKNASISVTGIWLAEDDGILNPRNVRLIPGTIIPKAVGSKGLTPLEAPGRFDVSQIILNDLRQKIRHTLLIDRLGPIGDRKMTATEVLERSAEMSRLLGAVYGRLQSELIFPLLHRIISILQRRGRIPLFEIGPQGIELEYLSPLARTQARADVGNAIYWLEAISKVGPEAHSMIDQRKLVRWLGESLGIPKDIIDNQDTPLNAIVEELIEEIG